MEIVVVDRVGDEVADFLLREHPGVRLIALDRSTGVPELRARGVRAAAGKIIAVLGDYCEPSSSWCREILAAHTAHSELVIGGVIEPSAPRSMADRAAFLCEYGACLDSESGAAVMTLPGPNVSYKRAVVEAAGDLLENGLWETLLHRRLERRGYGLRSSSRVRVRHHKHYTTVRFCRERYHFGRAFAAARSRELSGAGRLLHTATAPGLPLLLAGRVGWELAGRLGIGRVVPLTPYILLFMTAAGLGEVMGYVLRPGRRPAEFA